MDREDKRDEDDLILDDWLLLEERYVDEGAAFREDVIRDEYSCFDLDFVVFALELLRFEVALLLVDFELREEFRLL